ncbi:unnamed protein product [Kluyveromyces dobzhanskii CBS 2104]|uniref:WGS project CCBQ000000000 data, contig 00015 n=1 Tax=Kluyveromyces dobzhanskii CBS 2104 TaxID=1427455 RepID=A0A0A8LA87_9SACH|nr:unnamed protein product [Kluyveromyces dobzhanskii CBS 2104]
MAFEPIDTTTHSRAIEAEYLKVVKGDPDTTWLIISPNSKKQYEPELVGTSFSEFLQSFEDTKVQYGLARVSPPGSDVHKLILIGWCPDSAPLKTRASFAQNFGVISNQVFKTYHIQVTARDEDDLDESELLMKISNSAGARYSIQQQSQASKKPVSSAAKTAKKPSSVPSRAVEEKETKPSFSSKRSVSPEPLKRSSKKDDDWGEPELEERDFRDKPLKPNSSSWKPVGKVDLQKVIAEEKNKDDPRLVTTAATYDKKIDPQSEIAKLKEESKLKRDAEYSKVLGTKGESPVPSSGADNGDLLVKGFKNEKSPAQLWAEKKRQAAPSAFEKKVDKKEKEEEKEEEDEEEEEEGIQDIRSKFESLQTKEVPIIKPSQSGKFTPQFPRDESSENGSQNKNRFGQPLPGLHDQKKDEDDGWSDEEEESESEVAEAPAPSISSRRNVPPPPESDEEEEEDDEKLEEEEEEVPSLPARRSVPPPPESDDEEEVPSLPTRRNVPPPPESDEEEEEEVVDEDESAFAESRQAEFQRSIPPPAPRRTQQAKKASGPSAVAEYDYEAGEDNELTFEENARIVNIQFVDDDWWLGELESSGEKGLFPSNYVNLEE